MITYLLTSLTYVAQVGFASLALQVSSIEMGTCEAKVTRTGLFGDVRVEWKAGYPSGQAPPGLKLGAITPSSGKTPREAMISNADSHIISFLSKDFRQSNIFVCLPFF